MKKSVIRLITFFTFSFLFYTLTVVSQNIGINSIGVPAAPTAILDVSSTTKGQLVPRMNTIQMNAISLPATGLLIFNTDCNVFEYWNGSAWISLPSSTSTPTMPGAITGNTTICSGSSQNYSIVAVPGATSYTWTVPTGWVINSGQTTVSINTTAGSVEGNVCVIVNNACGASSSPSCIMVNDNSYSSGSQTFTCAGALQTFTVPACVNSINIKAWGAGGGGGGNALNASNVNGGVGGGGSYATSSNISVSPGNILQIYVGVGGTGGYGNTIGNIAWCAGGYGYGAGGNGGSDAYSGSTEASGGGGGGSSAVYNLSTSSLLLVAAGGGGGGGAGSLAGATGGTGGVGAQNGSASGNGGLGGTASANVNPNGGAGASAISVNSDGGGGGGGGGGYTNGGTGGGIESSNNYGGGGGAGGNSGGTSAPAITNGTGQTAGNSGGCSGCGAGGNASPSVLVEAAPGGNGVIVISW